MIPKETIDQIFAATDIVEVIQDFVPLKKSGSNFKAKSPFVDEKTPSFMVSPAKQIFKCFSSGKGGSAVSFLMELEHYTYPEALRYLAKKYGIEIEEREQTTEEQLAESEKESLGIVVNYAKDYFVEQMWNTDEGKSIGLGYFRERGFLDETIKTFELGYNPDKWDALTSNAKNKGYKEEFLITAGLTKKKDEKLFDFFKGRVMFPIHNLSGRTIAFGGRTLSSSKKVAKYFNSPENPLYNKSKVLFGLYQAKGEIIKRDQCYLVEGYTDVISLHQAGVKNVVSSSGTSLTQDQIKLIKRYTKNICVLYDGDAAGIKASFRGIDLILKEGLNVNLVLFPEGEDPDSFSRSVGQTELLEYLSDKAQDFLSFKSSLLYEESKNDPVKKAKLIHEVVNSIALIPDAIQRQVFIQETSKRLKVNEQVLINELNKLRRQSVAGSHPEIAPEVQVAPKQDGEPEGVSSKPQERELIRLLIQYGDCKVKYKSDEDEVLETSVAEFILHELEVDELKLSDSVCQRIVDEFRAHLKEDEFPAQDYFARHEDHDMVKLVADVVSSPYEMSEQWRKHKIYPTTEDMVLDTTVFDSLYRVKQKILMVRMHEVNLLIKAETDEEKLMALLAEKQKIVVVRNSIASHFGTTFL